MKGGKENEVVFYKKITFLKTDLHLCFSLFSLLEHPMQRNKWMLTFWGDCDVTSDFGPPSSKLEDQSQKTLYENKRN